MLNYQNDPNNIYNFYVNNILRNVIASNNPDNVRQLNYLPQYKDQFGSLCSDQSIKFK